MFLFLDLDGDSADHQDNLVRLRGDVLVEPALHIGKFTLHLVYRHASHTQLVRHEDQVGILPGEFIELRFEGGEGSFHVALIVEEEICPPKGYAIDHHDTIGKIVAAQVFLLLYIGPLGSTVSLVAFHPLPELLVPDSGGS